MSVDRKMTWDELAEENETLRGQLAEQDARGLLLAEENERLRAKISLLREHPLVAENEAQGRVIKRFAEMLRDLHHNAFVDDMLGTLADRPTELHPSNIVTKDDPRRDTYQRIADARRADQPSEDDPNEGLYLQPGDVDAGLHDTGESYPADQPTEEVIAEDNSPR